jgi:hypothetical protein
MGKHLFPNHSYFIIENLLTEPWLFLSDNLTCAMFSSCLIDGMS